MLPRALHTHKATLCCNLCILCFVLFCAASLSLLAHGYKEANLAFVRCSPVRTQSFILVWEGKSFRALWFYSPAQPQKSSQWEAWRAALGSGRRHSWQPRNQCPDVLDFRTTTTIMQSYKDMKYENTKIRKNTSLSTLLQMSKLLTGEQETAKTCEHSRKLGRGRERIGRRGKNSSIHSNYRSGVKVQTIIWTQ